MFSEHTVFLIGEIPVFILCDRWFPGTLAVGIMSYRHSVLGFYLFIYFSFVLMWPIITLPHLAGLGNRAPTCRSGSGGAEEE